MKDEDTHHVHDVSGTSGASNVNVGLRIAPAVTMTVVHGEILHVAPRLFAKS